MRWVIWGLSLCVACVWHVRACELIHHSGMNVTATLKINIWIAAHRRLKRCIQIILVRWPNKETCLQLSYIIWTKEAILIHFFYQLIKEKSNLRNMQDNGNDNIYVPYCRLELIKFLASRVCLILVQTFQLIFTIWEFDQLRLQKWH